MKAGLLTRVLSILVLYQSVCLYKCPTVVSSLSTIFHHVDLELFTCLHSQLEQEFYQERTWALVYLCVSRAKHSGCHGAGLLISVRNLRALLMNQDENIFLDL
jgi:hypothetical protein